MQIRLAIPSTFRLWKPDPTPVEESAGHVFSDLTVSGRISPRPSQVISVRGVLFNQGPALTYAPGAEGPD